MFFRVAVENAPSLCSPSLGCWFLGDHGFIEVSCGRSLLSQLTDTDSPTNDVDARRTGGFLDETLNSISSCVLGFEG